MAQDRIRTFYKNAAKVHPSLVDSIVQIIGNIYEEMVSLDYGMPNKCYIVSPSFLTLWNNNGWIDVSSQRTHWHYAYTQNNNEATIHDAEHSNNMSDEAQRPINEALKKILSFQDRLNGIK